MREGPLPQPEFSNKRWWAEIPTPTAFKTRKAACAALLTFRQERGCLYNGCWAEGTDDLGWGQGFRFCPRHAHHARKTLNQRTA